MTDSTPSLQKPRVKLQDIAERTGFAVSTISTILNGQRNMGFISDQTRQEVWRVAEELGYQRLRHARRPRVHEVGVFSSPADVYYEAVGTICQVLHERGYRAVVEIESDRPAVYASALEQFRKFQIDGALFIGSRTGVSDVPPAELPCVIVGSVPEGIQANCVALDQHEAGRLAGEHLWELGHRRVSVILWEGYGFRWRQRGLQAVWSAQGAPDTDLREALTPPVPIISGSAEERDFVRLIEETLATGPGEPPVTAFFCAGGDDLAAPSIRALHRLGLCCPEDVSIVSLDNTRWADLYEPALTTIDHAWAEMGGLAADLLLKVLQAPAGEIFPIVVYQPRLILRETTAPPKPT